MPTCDGALGTRHWYISFIYIYRERERETTSDPIMRWNVIFQN